MKAVGLVVEYNPFHNGHRYHLQQARLQTNADVVVAVMSGNFTQRGEPAIVDKWTRAKVALQNGIDLVIELPTYAAVQPAHRFANGALELLAGLGVKTVVFGAEHPEWDFEQLVAAENQFSQTEFKNYRATYATQFNQQLQAQTGKSLIDPNDILAFAYTKANLLHHYGLALLPIQRQGSRYHDQLITGKIASASAIRQAVQTDGNYQATVPIEMATALQKIRQVPSWVQLYPLLRNQLIQAPLSYLRPGYLMAEGLEYRMKEAAQRSLTFQEYMKFIKTKRYTYAYLLRLSLYTLLQVTAGELEKHCQRPYYHVLGFNRRGQEYLHTIKKQAPFPLITKIDQDLRDGMLNLDYRAGKLYQVFTKVEQDLKHPPVIIK